MIKHLAPHMLYIFGKPWAYPKFGYMSDKAKYNYLYPENKYSISKLENSCVNICDVKECG